MEGWTTKAGFPVVEVHSPPGELDLRLTQERFMLDPDFSEPLVPSKWTIPISVGYPTERLDTYPETWLHAWEDKIPLSVDRRPYLLNVKATGYYRVNYDAENWKLLKQLLLTDANSTEAVTRAQLVDDSFALARAGRLDYGVPLGISSYGWQEKEYVGMTALKRGLDYLNLRLRHVNRSYEKLKVNK